MFSTESICIEYYVFEKIVVITYCHPFKQCVLLQHLKLLKPTGDYVSQPTDPQD